MNIENIELQEVLSSEMIFGGENYEKSPLSLYLNNSVSSLKTKENSLKIKETLMFLNEFLSGERTKLKEEVGQSLVKLFSIDLILKGKAPNHSVCFQKTLFDNPSLTFDLIEQMFKYGEKTVEDEKVVLNKELAEFALKMELNEPSIKETKLLNSGLRAIKNRSELDLFMLSEKNMPLIVKKLEDEDSYFLNKEKLVDIKKNKTEIAWRESAPNFGSLLYLEKMAHIKSVKIKADESFEQDSILEKENYFGEHNFKLMTAIEKSQYISVGKNYDIFKDNVNSQSVVSFSENGDIEKILFNYSPITKSIQLIENEKTGSALIAACKFLASLGVKKIELTEVGLTLDSKELKTALLASNIKENRNKRNRQENKRK